MRKKMKKLMNIGLSVVLILSMLGCGSKENSGTTSSSGSKKTMNKELIFTEKELADASQIGLDSVEQIRKVGDRIYIYGSNSSGNYETFVVSLNMDGSDIKRFSVPSGQLDQDGNIVYDNNDVVAETGDISANVDGATEDIPANVDGATGDISANVDGATEDIPANVDGATEDTSANADGSTEKKDIVSDDYTEDEYFYGYQSFSNFSVDNSGNSYFVRTKYQEKYTNGSYDSTNEVAFVKYDKDGNIIQETPVESEDENTYIYVNAMAVTEDGLVYVNMGDTQIDVYDSSFKKIESIPIGDGISSVNQIVVKEDEILILGMDLNYEKYVVMKVNTSDNSTGELLEVPGNAWNYNFYPGNSEADFYLTDSLGIYKWSVGDEEITNVMNLIDSDINTNYMSVLCEIDQENFIACYNDNFDYANKLVIFTKADPSTVADKEVLTLACYYLNYNVKDQIIKFNKSNDKYRIQINTYSQYDEYGTEAGITRMNNDIAGGNVPDIFILNSELPSESYAEKGLFEDLNAYIEKDNELNREDFAENVLDAYSTDGKLYRLVPMFSIITLTGKSSVVGTEPGWTMEEANNIMSQYEGSSLFDASVYTRDNILSNAMNMIGGNFLDLSKGECYFNTDEFIQLLEFVNTYPEEIIYDDEGMEWESDASKYRSNKVLCAYTYLSYLNDISYTKIDFGEDITFIGFPSSKGNGAVIQSNLELAMSSKSQNKDGAWEFLRYYLTDEYQENISYSLPLSKKAMEKFAEEATKKPYYTDENGNKVEYDNTYYIDDKEVVIDPMTADEVKELTDYIYSVDQVSSAVDENIINIITEEAGSYFSGQKTASEVAEIIQSRANIYVNENL